MKNIVTISLNPAIDSSCEADRVHPTRKLRTRNARYDPGGGGINVARMVTRLGGSVRAIYLAGGATGPVLDSLLDRDGIVRSRIDISGDTRISQTVHELETGLEYRFVAEGPELSEAEWQGCLAALGEIGCDYLVLSGSLPRNVPADFYARLVARLKENTGRILLDTSGPALRATLEGGGIFLVKPSRGELEQFAGHVLADERSLAEVARNIVRSGMAQHVAITLGREGALLVSAESELRLPALEVDVRSAVGAGDSFLGAIAFALASGQSVREAALLGLAAGTATVMTPGTGLCHLADVQAISARMSNLHPDDNV